MAARKGGSWLVMVVVVVVVAVAVVVVVVMIVVGMKDECTAAIAAVER